MFSTRLVKSVIGLVILATAEVVVANCTTIDTTHFWFSTDGHSSTLGDVPLLHLSTASGAAELFLWGRPSVDQTIGNLAFDVVESTGASVAKLTSATMDNPSLGTSGGKPAARFEHTPAPKVTGSNIFRLQGFSVGDLASTGLGIGPVTRGTDAFYDATNDAWRIGTLTLEGISDGMSSLFLQLGENGINVSSPGGLETTDDVETVLGDAADNALCAADTSERQVSSTRSDTSIVVGPLMFESPGNGVIFVEGPYFQKKMATLGISIDGTDASKFDRLASTRTVSLSGILEVTTNTNGGTYGDPSVLGTSDLFELISGADVTGMFSSVFYDGIELNEVPVHEGDGLFRSIEYTPTGVFLRNYRAIPGDTDGDLDIDFVDFVTLSGNFQAMGDWEDGDFGGNGIVDFPDFVGLSNNFGTALPSKAVIPEPNAATLVILSLLFLIMGRRTSPQALTVTSLLEFCSGP